MRAITPYMKPVPPGADRATRERMFLEYVDELVRLNPRLYLPLGVKRRWWHLKLEHPRTSRTTKALTEARNDARIR